MYSAAGAHSDGREEKESAAAMRGKRRHSQYPFLPRHLGGKEQRDKRSRWMEMELMVKESVTGSNKSMREWADVSDRKIWTKKGLESEADMEGGEGRWKLSTREEWLGTGSEYLTKGQTNGRRANTSPWYEDVPWTPRCPLHWHRAPAPCPLSQSRSNGYHLASPAYSGHALRSACLRCLSGSHVYSFTGRSTFSPAEILPH